MESVTQALAPFRDRLEALGITRIGIFGSTVRGEARSDSDVDLLIETSENSRLTLFTLIELEQDLTEAIGRKVDLVLSADLRPRIRGTVLSEVKYI